jgi:MFS family permease
MTADLILVAVSLLFWGLGEGMFLYFQPLYLQQLGASPLGIGAILGSLGIAMSIAQIPAGYLADRWGRRPFMWASWILGMLSSWVMALAPSLNIFVGGMLFYTLTSFVLAPMNAYITHARGKWSTGQALTFANACYYFGAVAGPLIGGTVASKTSLKQVYLIASIVFLFSTLIVLWIKPQPVETLPQEEKHISLLGNRQFLTYMVMIFIVMFATYLPSPLTPNFLQNERNLSIQTIGQLGSLGSLGNVVLALTIGRMHAPLAFLLGQISVGLFALLLWRGTGTFWFGAGYFFFGGYRVVRSMALALMHPLIPPTEIGLAYGFVETANAVAVILAPLVAGILYDHTPTWVYIGTLGALVLSLTVSSTFLRRYSHSHAQLAESADPIQIEEVHLQETDYDA